MLYQIIGSLIISIILPLTIFLICYFRRKEQIGGWLLFYFIQIFFGVLMTLVTSTILFLYLKDSSGAGVVMLIIMLPNLIIWLAICVVSIMLTLKRFRAWKYINYLRALFVGKMILAILMAAAPGLPTMSFILILPYWITWLLYFSLSKRVISVYNK